MGRSLGLVHGDRVRAPGPPAGLTRPARALHPRASGRRGSASSSLVPGVVAALDAIDLPACVASSGEHERMRFTLGRTGLYERFAGRIFSASEVERGKPAPDLFLHAAEQMGFDPSLTTVVEDTVPGVQAGRAAGSAWLGVRPAHAGRRPRGRGRRAVRRHGPPPRPAPGYRPAHGHE